MPLPALVLNRLYLNGGFSSTSGITDYTEETDVDTVLFEDLATTGSSFYTNALLFSKKEIETGTFMVYGLELGVSGSKTLFDDVLAGAGQDTTVESSSFYLTGPKIRFGLEKKMKWATFRFGFARYINLYRKSTTKIVNLSGTNPDIDETTLTSIGKSGSFSFNSGLGFYYKGLKIDLLLNNDFWTRGPQLLFDGTGGGLGVSADIAYVFGK